MTRPTAGFFGKMPSRGDFVRRGLPAGTVAALDDWCQDVMQGGRALLGERWVAAWMDAPIWRFWLAAGCCGPDAFAGVWMPSMDRAGRLFPLILGVVDPGGADPGLAGSGGALDRIEAIGVSAVEQDIAPDDLAAALDASVETAAPSPLGGQLGEWWTEGSLRVGRTRKRWPALPDAAGFAVMLEE